MTARQPLNVLFLCTHNSARSIIAECVINRLGDGKFKGYSAGSQPSGTVHPYTMDLLRHLNYETSALRSKSWEEFTAPDAPQLDFVFTVCDDAANEVCPVWPGQPMSAHWGLPDPSAAQGTEGERRFAFADTHRMLYQRIGVFTNLPLASLSGLSLQRRLDDIGRDKVFAPEPTK
jgi:arsenate reductase